MTRSRSSGTCTSRITKIWSRASTSFRGCGCTRSRTTTAWWRCSRSFPTSGSTFNLVPSLLVQLEAFAEDQAHDRYLELGLEAGRRADPGRYRVHPAELLSRAAPADDRPLSALRRAAGAAGQCHGGAADLDAAVAPLHDRRPPRSAGLAEAGLDRPVYLDWRSRGCGRSSKRGATSPRTTRRVLRAIELELLNAVIPAYRRACGRGPDRNLDLTLLPPDSAAAVRHGRLQAHAPAVGDAAAPLRAPRGCRASNSNGRPPVTSGCSAGGRSGCGRPKGRCRTR